MDESPIVKAKVGPKIMTLMADEKYICHDTAKNI